MIKHIVFSVIIFVMMLLTSCQYRITNKAWVNDSLVLDKTHITESNGGGTSSYAFRDFSSIDVGGVVDVVYTQGNNYSVRIEEVSNLMTVVKKNNHELSVYTKRPKGKLISIGNEKRPSPPAKRCPNSSTSARRASSPAPACRTPPRAMWKYRRTPAPSTSRTWT